MKRFLSLHALITYSFLIFFVIIPQIATVAAQGPAEIGSIILVIKNIIKLLVPAAAIAFLIMMIVGGIQFVMSGGDAKAAAGARSTLTYAVIGVILVVIVWLILLLIQNVTGVNVTEVVFPTIP